MKLVIICGGVGSKMWPLSRASSPKHFLPLLNNKSLFQSNWESLRKKFKPEDIFLQTNAVQAEIAKKQVPEIVEDNVFIEPEMRNHGPATGFAAAQLIKRGYGDEPFMLIQADVLREPAEKFLEMIAEVEKLALTGDKYITGGFSPTRIVGGVDYLVKGKLVLDKGNVKIYEVADYIARTEEEKIKQYLGTDKLLLHTNHTTMTPNNLLLMYKQYKPEWYGPSVAIAKNGEVVTEYAKMPAGAIEEVTVSMFRNGRALVVELPFKWVDFGTWESVAEFQGNDQLPNSKYSKQIPNSKDQTEVLEIEGGGNFVRSKKFVATIGVSDLMVVETDDALLVMKKGEGNKVGQVVDWLKEKERKELL